MMHCATEEQLSASSYHCDEKNYYPSNAFECKNPRSPLPVAPNNPIDCDKKFLDSVRKDTG
jgi:hypothetical protein